VLVVERNDTGRRGLALRRRGHPGSGVAVGPGRNAAIAICQDRGIAFRGIVYGKG
jgi:hypothetical protein